MTNVLGNLQLAGGPADTGEVGRIGPLKLMVDGNIPTNLGGGTNESRIITARFSELFLYQGQLRTRVLLEVLSGTLQVRLQVYNYVIVAQLRLA